ncbi:MAG TPA: hypothetical protein VNO30_31880 [Kofleriaceae bacterium]|nr:hypothetical protein [Kofleriaceae bacterium]
MRDVVALALALAVTLVALRRLASADSPVVVPADDTRTHAIVSRRSVALSAWYARLDDSNAAWFQVGAGPSHWKLPFRGASMGELERWTLRGRFGFLASDDADVTWAPLTLAAQRITVYDTLSVLPLIHFQSGVELAVSTPWLSDRELDPGPLGARVYTADTELVRNGWSVRPASWHARIDLLLCRSMHLEGGAGPEVFRSTRAMDRARGVDIGLRWRFSVGFSFACPARSTPFADVTASMQYSARALLYNREVAPSYDDRMQFALQYQPNRFALAVFTTPDARMLGVRIQVEAGGPDR